MGESSSRHKGWYWGHPDAEPIDSKEYQKETSEVSTIIDYNRSNPMVQNAITSIDEWLKDAFESEWFLYKRILARLWDVGIRGKDVLVEASGLTLFRYRYPYRFLSDRHFTHVLGNKVIRIVPYWGYTKGYEHNGVGLRTIKNLSGAHMLVCRAVLQNLRNEERVRKDMSTPLNISF